MSNNNRPPSSPSENALSRRWETWGLTFLAVALLLNIVFDDSPAEYVALAFAVAALVCAVQYLVRLRKRKEE